MAACGPILNGWVGSARGPWRQPQAALTKAKRITDAAARRPACGMVDHPLSGLLIRYPVRIAPLNAVVVLTFQAATRGLAKRVVTLTLAAVLVPVYACATPEAARTTPPATLPPQQSPTASLVPSPGPSPALRTPSPTPPATPASGAGYLEGKADIGPLVPVEKVGVPPPTPSPAVCTARGLTVRDAKTGAEVARFNLQPDCTYRVALKPGTYIVDLQRTQGIGGSKDLPKTVEIESGKTVRLDISIDTGIR